MIEKLADTRIRSAALCKGHWHVGSTRQFRHHSTHTEVQSTPDRVTNIIVYRQLNFTTRCQGLMELRRPRGRRALRVPHMTSTQGVLLSLPRGEMIVTSLFVSLTQNEGGHSAIVSSLIRGSALPLTESTQKRQGALDGSQRSGWSRSLTRLRPGSRLSFQALSTNEKRGDER